VAWRPVAKCLFHGISFVGDLFYFAFVVVLHDPRMSIFGFRGGSWALLTAFTRDMPKVAFRSRVESESLSCSRCSRAGTFLVVRFASGGRSNGGVFTMHYGVAGQRARGLVLCWTHGAATATLWHCHLPSPRHLSYPFPAPTLSRLPCSAPLCTSLSLSLVRASILVRPHALHFEDSARS